MISPFAGDLPMVVLVSGAGTASYGESVRRALASAVSGLAGRAAKRDTCPCWSCGRRRDAGVA